MKACDWLAIVLLLLLAAPCFTLGAADRALWGSCEPLSAEIAREMYESGDYIVPRVNYAIRLTKPPVYHWMTAASYRFLGVTEFAARLPSILAALASVIATFILARAMIGTAAGFVAGLLLVLCIEFAWNAQNARTDMVFAAFTTISCAAFYLAAASGRRGLYLAAFALAGLAAMSKAPLAVAVALPATLGYLYVREGRAGLRKVPWLAGTAVFLAVILPWPVAVFAKVSGDRSLFFVFGQMAEWFEREAVGAGAGALAFFQYIPYVLWGFFPWSLFLPGAIYLAVSAIRRRLDLHVAFVLVWFVAGFIILSIPRMKAPRYMTPMYPAAAILVAWLWVKAGGKDDFGRRARRVLVISAAAVPAALTVVVLLVAVAPARARSAALALFDPLARHMLLYWLSLAGERTAVTALVVGTVLVLALCAFVFAAVRRRTAAMGALVALALVTLGVINLYMLPALDGAIDVRGFMARLDKTSEGKALALAGPQQTWQFAFYLRRRIETVAPEVAADFLRENPHALVLMEETQLAGLGESERGRLVVVFRERFKVSEMALVALAPDRGAAEEPAAAGD